MLPAPNRLKLSRHSPQKFAKKISLGPLVLRYNETIGSFKLAVVVSKKTAQNATDRNRIRRIITEAIKQIKMPRVELMIIVKENIAKQKTQEIKKLLETAIKKI